MKITTAEHVDRRLLTDLMPPALSAPTIVQLADDEILIARSGDSTDSQIAGALVWRLGEDSTAYVWCPVASPDVVRGNAALAESVYRGLLSEVIRLADHNNSWFSQCLLGSSRIAERNTMLQNGFDHIASLRLLRREFRSSLTATHVSANTVEVHMVDLPADTGRMASLLEATWQHSLDCPQVNGHRTGVEAVNFRTIDETRCSRIYHQNGIDIGILTTSHNDKWLSVEYMGVVPSARGKGFGKHIIEDAIQIAAAQKLGVELSVDAANEPACRIYSELQFATKRRLEVLGRFHPDRC